MITSAGTASSIAASTVQRPSPESWTKPENFSNCGSFASAAALRSSSHDEMTLPRRQTSAISGRFSVKRSSSGRSLRVLVTQDVEALGVGLHQSVLDAVVHHLDEVPGAGRTGMDVAALGAGIAFRRGPACAGYRRAPEPAPRRSDRGDPPPLSVRRSSCNSRARCPRRRRTCRNRRSECASSANFFARRMSSL